MDDKTLASIFEDEDKAKKTRLERKMEKKKAKEKKIYDDFIEEQKNKKLEQTSDINKTKKISDNINLEKTRKIKDVENKLDKSLEINPISINSVDLEDETFNDIKKESVAFNIFFGFITLVSFFSSIGYVLYAYLKNLNQSHLINGGILVAFTFFYMISSLARKNGIKKAFGFLASLLVILFIGYQLFIL